MQRTPITLPKTKVVIGIDPGRMGAIAVLGFKDIIVRDCPTHNIEVAKKKRIRCDPHGMATAIKLFRGPAVDTHVFLEKVGPMPKQGVTSMFTFGESFGYWQGVLAALEIPYTMVHPITWTKVMLKGMRGKDAARQRAAQLFPDIDLGAKSKGRADALLIAEYGRRELG